MNISTPQERDYLHKFERMIELGASASDLRHFYPEYFGDTLSGSVAKSHRVYKTIKPTSLKSKPSRDIAFHCLITRRGDLKTINNFALLLYPQIKSRSNRQDLNETFLSVYQGWVSANGDSFNFQKARSVYTYLLSNLCCPESQLFNKCPKCDAYYLNTQNYERVRKSCPYC